MDDVWTSSAGMSAGGGRSSTSRRTITVASWLSTVAPATDSGELAASSSEEEKDLNNDQSTLFKTAAVGSALLALNVIVFTAVMCQWRGLRRTRLIELQKYASGVASSGAGEIVLGVPCPSAAADDVERVVATYTAPESPEAQQYEPATPSPHTATVLTSAECTCNNIQDGGSPGILLRAAAAPNNYYTMITNHVTSATADYANQRTTSTV